MVILLDLKLYCICVYKGGAILWVALIDLRVGKTAMGFRNNYVKL